MNVYLEEHGRNSNGSENDRRPLDSDCASPADEDRHGRSRDLRCLDDWNNGSCRGCRGSISDGCRVADGGSDDRNVGSSAASNRNSGSSAGVASSGSRDNAFSLNLANFAVRVDDSVGLFCTSSGETFRGGLVFGLVDVSWLGFIGFASADGADFAEDGGFPDSVPALRDCNVVGDCLGDWVGDVRDRGAPWAAAVGIGRSIGIIHAAEIRRIAGCGEEISCISSHELIGRLRCRIRDNGKGAGWSAGDTWASGIICASGGSSIGSIGSGVGGNYASSVGVGGTEEGDALTILATLACGAEDGGVEAADTFEDDIGVGISKGENIGVQANVFIDSDNT